MPIEQPIFKPRQYYETTLKKDYHQAAGEFYEALAREAGTDKAANAMHVKTYNELSAELEAAKKKLGSVQAGKTWLIIGVVVAFIAALGTIIFGAMHTEYWWLFIIGGVCIALGVLGIVMLATKIKNAVKDAQAIVDEKAAEVQKAYDVCVADMAALNDLLDDTMPMRIMEKCSPIIDLDPTFTPARLCHLMDTFGMAEETDPDTSVEGVISGQIQGNPFVLERVFRHELADKEWHGSLVITWTTTSVDSEGHTHTEHHSETLHATAVHPAPNYWHETRLIFGSEVAPHLHFSRAPSGMSNASDREREKFVRNRIKALDKIEAEAIKAGRNFTKLGNDEFEAYWGADDRDHEVEYRLLFSALAQQNLTDLIKNPQPYGDDFYMVKDGMLTSVASAHSQSFDYHASADSFASHDFEAGKAHFVEYCDEFIRGLYFDLAPILSIPNYQMYKPRDYIYGDTYRCHTTSFEHETLVNAMEARLFRPGDADPSLPLVLKEIRSKKVGGSDQVRIRARSYSTCPECDYVPVFGGDGHWHDVPVPWTRYDEVQSESNVAVAASNKTLPQWHHSSLDGLKKYLDDRGFRFERGLLSIFLGENRTLTPAQGDEILAGLNK